MARMESVLSKNKVELGISRYEVFIIFISFFLGRVSILEKLTPFGIAFMAAYIILKGANLSILASSMLGTISVQGVGGIYYYIGAILIYLYFTKYKGNKDLNLIASSTITASLFILAKLATIYLTKTTFVYDFVLIAFEGLLVFTMSYLFTFGAPIEGLKKRQMTNEEIICSFVTLALALSGLRDISFLGASFKNIISLSAIIYLSYTQGILMGGTMGILIGMVAYISNVEMPFIIAILGVGGALAGLFKDLGKSGSVLGFILGSIIISFYINGLGTSFIKWNEIMIASVLFIGFAGRLESWTKKISVRDDRIKKDYENRRFELASKKLSNMSELLDRLAESFRVTVEEKDIYSSAEIYNSIAQIKDEKCKNCVRCKECWDEDYYTTYYSLLTSIGIMGSNIEDRDKLISSVMSKCSDNLFQIISNVYNNYNEKVSINRKYMDQRMVLIEQLEGLSQIVDNINLDIYKDTTFNIELEEMLVKEIKNHRVDINEIIVSQMGSDNIEIYMEFDTLNSLEKAEKVTNIISNALGYPVTSDYTYGAVSNTNRFKLIRTNRYSTLTKVSALPNSEDGISGDNFTYGEVENTSFVAISDGMGIGKRASAESTTAIEILEKMMEINADKEMTIKTINSVLRTKSDDEIFTTLDLSFIDLYSGKLQMIKSGTPPTFIKKKDDVILINSRSLPIGILKDIDFNVYEENIEDGDLIIMMSDGILDSNKDTDNPEEWIKKVISGIESINPQIVADEILNIAKLHGMGEIKDDMTVLVTKVWKN